MGVLSYAALGGLEGAGRGMAQVGQQQVTERMRLDEQTALENRRLRYDEEHQNRIDERVAMRQDMKNASGTGSGSHSGSGKAPALGALDIASDPEKLALLGGVSRDDADAYVSMQRGGKQPGDTSVALSPDRFTNPDRRDEAGPARDQPVPAYTPGAAAALRDRAIKGLYQAMKLADPSHADDLSKSQGADQVTGYVAEYRATGDERAGSAAMVGQGKPAYNEDGSVVTGKVAPGTVADAKVTRDRAAANNSNASAGEHSAKTGVIKDERDGKVSIKAQVAALSEERKALAGSRADLKAQESALKGQFGDDIDQQRRTIAARRVTLDARDDELASKIGALRTQATVVDEGGKGKGALASAGKGDTADSVKAMFKAGKLTREQAKTRLQALGYE